MLCTPYSRLGEWNRWFYGSTSVSLEVLPVTPSLALDVPYLITLVDPHLNLKQVENNSLPTIYSAHVFIIF